MAAPQTESPIEGYIPAIALGVAAVGLLLITAAGRGAPEPAPALVATAPAPVVAPTPDADARTKALALEAILENPEIVMQAIEILRAREAEAEAAAAANALAVEAETLFAGADAPVIGNPEGDVTLVEFFDYNCGYCRRVAPAVAELIETDPNLRVVMREFPILSEESGEAARLALAAHELGADYAALHDAMMTISGTADGLSALDAAEAVGLDPDALEAAAESPTIQAHIAESNRLAQALGIRGTPAFVIGDTIIPGAVGVEDLRAAVATARAG